MPNLEDIEKIEHMLRELGETEMGGEVPSDYPRLKHEKKMEAPAEKEEIDQSAEVEIEGEPVSETSEAPPLEEIEIPTEIPGEEEEETGEEILDLPEDFDLEKLAVEEGPSIASGVSKKPVGEEGKLEEGRGEGEIFSEEKSSKGKPSEKPFEGEKVLEEGVKIAEEIESREEEPLFEIQEYVSEKPKEGETEVSAGETVEKREKEAGEEEKLELEPGELEALTGAIEGEETGEVETAPEEETSGIEVLGEITGEEDKVEEVDEIEGKEVETEAEEDIELPGIEEIEKEAETIPLEEGIEEVPAGEVEETPSGEEFKAEESEEEYAEYKEEQKEKKAEKKEPYELDIELSDEDIVLIQSKLKELSPNVANNIKNIIVNTLIPAEQMTQLIELLLQDAPEREIVSFIEEVTGKKVPPMRMPPEVFIPAKPSFIEVLKENLTPLMRVSFLSLLIALILGAIFFIFAWKPIKANRFYKQAAELIRNARYEDGELNFKKAISIYERISQYDRIGWEYALSGNYALAEQKLKTGMKKDPELKYPSLRLHLAKLYNVQKRFKEADSLYSEVLKRYPDKYEYIKLKGENLIDWGRVNRAKLDEAYRMFDDAYVKNIKNSDPLFQLLYISLLKEDDENIKYQYELLSELYPDDVNPVVYTELASYLIKNGNLESVREVLYKVTRNPPYYPSAFYVFSLYYRAIGNKKEEERMLKYAIQLEMERELKFPWDSRDYDMISSAYNNLGELYSRMELPGKIAEAINFFKKAIDVSPDNPKPYFNLAHLYFYKEKDYGKAMEYYLKAKNLGYINDEVVYNLGVLYFFKRDYYRAYLNWAKLSEKMPDNPYVEFALGTSLLNLGRYEAALAEFMMLADIYNGLVKSLGEIKPWRAYHARILKEASKVYNNLGVSYQKLFEKTGKTEYQTNALTALYKGGELADIIGIGRGKIQYNINYILHPDVLRDMAIDNDISPTYVFEALG